MKERLLLFLLLSAGIFACSPKYTASFGPSRNFYTEPESVTANAEETTTTPNVQQEIIEETPVVAVEQLIASTSHTQTEEPKKANELVEKYSKSSIPTPKEIVKMPSKKRKRMLKEVKKDIKELKKAKKKSVENRKIYAGIIIALAGVVVAILASGAIGALGIIVGVALIAWGLIEQGGI